MSRKKGFTLVEILVAMTIMVIAIAAIYTSFRGGMTSWTKGTARMERFLNARAALDMMSREISSALIAAYGSHVIDFIGIPIALRFAAPMDGHAGSWDMVEIAYRHVPGGREIERAFIYNPAFNQGPLSFTPLVSNITYLRFDFFDAQLPFTGSAGPHWRDAAWRAANPNITPWDSRTTAEIGIPGVTEDPATVGTLPRAVRITITVQDELRRELEQTFSTIVYLPTSR